MIRNIKLTILISALSATTLFASAHDTDKEKFAVKAHADILLTGSMSSKSTLADLSKSASETDFGVDFATTVWQKKQHILDLNVGLSYSTTTLKMSAGAMSYDYAAPAEADMDGDTYTRYYEISAISQKNSLNRLMVPVYLSYGYRCSPVFKVHFDLGVRLGFKAGAKVMSTDGQAYSYGIYPQYDNLKIEESYLNDFGTTDLSKAPADAPEANSVTASAFAGIGLEFRIYGPLAADLSVHYDTGLTNLYKPAVKKGSGFTATDAPVSYTVAGGQQVKSLSDYLISSKLSKLTLSLSLIWHF